MKSTFYNTGAGTLLTRPSHDVFPLMDASAQFRAKDVEVACATNRFPGCFPPYDACAPLTISEIPLARRKG